MQLDSFISIPDQGRVVDAIGDAEKMTSGEIRVHLTPKCGKDVMREAIAIIDWRAQIEVSGNVDEAKAATLVDLGVDFVSSGALTHSAPILDLSLKHLSVIE